MDWLGGWLKTVIMVILLATFADLLLPSNTMQRYVKTVLSLFILLTLLSPVVQLLRKDWSVDQLLASAETRQSEAALQAGGGKNLMKSLDDITREAQKLAAEGNKQSVQLIQTRLAELMKEDLQKQTDLAVSDVQVRAQIDNNGKPFITDVRVTLHDIEAKRQPQPGAKDGSIAAMQPVKPVDPVRIDIQAGGKSAPASKGQEPLPQRLQQERDRLIQGISRDWQIKPAQIGIRILTDAGKL